MKKRFEKILTELVTDYETTRVNFDTIEDITSQEVSIQAMANTLVLIQTQLHNLKIWQEYLNLGEEQRERKLQLKHIALEIKIKEEKVAEK